MANHLQISSNCVPESFAFYNAYPYAYKSSKNGEEHDFATRLFSFKDLGKTSIQISNAFINLAKRLVVSFNTNKDTVFINMPSSKGLTATKNRWTEVNEDLHRNHLNVLSPSVLYYDKPKKEAHSVGSDGKRNMEYDVLDGLVFNCQEQIKGKHVVLLDDVLTTGRHLRFIGDKLREMGAVSVSEVALCCTPPKPGHDDTRYRYKVIQDDYCKKHTYKFSQDLNPNENQSAFYDIDMRERQLNLFDLAPKATPVNEAYLQPSSALQQAAEKKEIYNKQTNNDSIIMAKENQQQPAQQAEKTISLPKQQNLSYANVSPIKKQDGTEVKTTEPRFSTTIRLGDIAKMQKTNARIETGIDGKEHKYLDLAIVPNKKYEEGKNSPFLIIAKRNGTDAQYNGKDVKFVDKDAVLEFTVNSAQLLAKANKLLGKSLDDTVQLHIGKNGAGATGVTFNPAEYPTVDKKELEIGTQRITTVNSFDRTIKSQQNMDRIGQNRYVDKYIGSAFGFNVKDANKNTVLNEKTNQPIRAYNITLKAADITFLPEADKFGNINLAIVKRDLSPEKLSEKGLTLKEGSEFPEDARGFKQPNYMVIADPKTYKNGEPNEHVVALIKMNKAELKGLPTTTEQFTTKEGKEVSNEYIHISTDRFGQVKANVKDYEFHNVVASDTKITSRITTYNPDIALKERQTWESKNPRLSETEFAAKIEREKDMPTQYDAYKQAVQVMQEKSQSQEQKTGQHTEKAQKEYKDYSQTDCQEQQQSKGKKMPF